MERYLAMSRGFRHVEYREFRTFEEAQSWFRLWVADCVLRDFGANVKFYDQIFELFVLDGELNPQLLVSSDRRVQEELRRKSWQAGRVRVPVEFYADEGLLEEFINWQGERA